MSETLETPTVKARFASWRAQHSDLPVVLYVLALLKSILSEGEEAEKAEVLQSLKRRGSQLARRRALFIAAEATGHLATPQKGTESQAIIEDLGVIIKEGNSLHKVRALRGMRFIASEECIPFLEQALEDSSPWVQATALHTLLRLNLRHKKPRRVFQTFLLSTFRQGLTQKSLFSKSDYIRNFYLNKGLFVGLIKESGGIPLAAMSLFLWFTTIILKTAIPLLLVAVAIAACLPAIVFAGADMPFWIRRAGTEHHRPLKRHFFFALLDYGFVLLFVWICQRIDAPYIIGILSVWGVMHMLTGIANKSSSRFSEELRTLNRFLLGGVTAFLAARLGESYTTVLMIAGLAVLQLPWALPGIVRVVIAEREKLKTFGRNILIFIRELARVIGPKLLHLLSAVVLGVRNTKRSTRVVVCLFILFAAALVLWLKLGFQLQEPTLLRIRFQFDSLIILLRPFLDLTLGVILMLLYFSTFSIGVHLVWDELLIIERIRFQTLARRPSHFNSMSEFVAYVIRAVKNPDSPLAIRIRAVLALGQVPLANPNNINQLLDLAEDENLPPKVRDAIFQVVDAAEKRLQRGQNSALSVDMDAVNRQIEPLWSPGLLLRTNIRYGLLALLLFSTAVGFLLWLTPHLEVTGKVALVEMIVGAVFLLYYMVTLGEVSDVRKSLFIISCGLLSVSLTYPLQPILSEWFHLIPDLGFGLVDQATFWALAVPTMLFIVAAQVGHTTYLLDADVPIESTPIPEESVNRAPDRSGIVYELYTRIHRLRFQPNIVSRVLLVGILVAAIQCGAFQELIDLRKERMPAFVSDSGGTSVRLENIPMDGRLVRVALVSAPNADITPLMSDTFPTVVDYLSGKFVPREIDAIYYYDSVCYGEVWISVEAGRLQAWNTLPQGCLGTPIVIEDRATFDVAALCGFHHPVRLVAMVYSSARSFEVKKRADPTNVRLEYLAASASNRTLLADTVTPFVRPVWSAPMHTESSRTKP